MILGSLAAAAIAAICITPFIGSVPTPITDVLNGTGEATDIFWRLRVPRVTLAFLAGAGLGIAGMTFQAMFRNPLATPFTLGVSSGAALGAGIAIRLGWTITLLGISPVVICSFVGALASLLIVYGITLARRGFSTAIMLLAGVAVSFFFSSVLLFIQYISDFSSSFRIVRWLMGGLETVGYDAAWGLAPFVVSGVAIVAYLLRELNLLAIGDDIAVSRGVNTAKAKCMLFIGTTMMVGGVVAFCGPIGFVGMMAPHICRLLIGSEHRYLMPATLLFGGTFLILCDLLARTLIAPAEIPVGVITALLGGPFFVWLLLRRTSTRHIMQ